MTLVVAWVPTSGSVRFTVTGIAAGQTVKRVAPGDALQGIRGYGDESWISGGSGFGYDYEMPLGVTVRYAVVPIAATTLPGGTATAGIFTETPGRQNGEAWLRDIMQPILSQPVSVLSTGDERRVARQAVYDIAGKPNPVVVWDSRTSRQGTVTLAVQNLPVSGVWENDTPRDKMDLLLSSGRPLLLSLCANLGFKPCYMAVADATYTRVGDGAVWALQLDYVEVDNPAALGVYPVAEITYAFAQTIPPDAIYQDWTPVTYLDIATRSS
jgi:hypothetical protein